MVSNYSSYLEFIGAVYFSMSLDEILTRKIWSPLDVKMQSRALDGLGVKDDKDFKQAVLDANKKKGEILQKELSKKSVIGLFIIAALLVFCGYEQCIEQSCIDFLPIIQLELAYTCTLFLVSLFVFQWLIYKKWKFVVFYIVGIYASFGIISHYSLIINHSNIEDIIVDNIGLYVCIIVTIPILWQIFITWIHKNVFYGYIKSKIIQARNKHEDTMKLISEGNVDNLPEKYKSIYLKNSVMNDTSTKKALDDSLTEYKGVLYNDIRTIGLNAKMYKLLLSWFIHKCALIWNWLKNLLKSKGTIVIGVEKLQVKDYAFHAKAYQEMKKKDKTLKMASYCEIAKISIDEFRKYYCKYCQAK